MLKNYYDDEYSASNRERRLNPKRGYGYCACDRVQLGDWTKCKICGVRNGRKRLKR